MTVERIVRIAAGFMVLLSLIMAHTGGTIDLTQASWLWLAAFVGANLFQSGFTNLCPLVTVLKKMGVKESGSCCQ